MAKKYRKGNRERERRENIEEGRDKKKKKETMRGRQDKNRKHVS